MAAKKSPLSDFEKSLEELEKLVEQLERGELTLEAALNHFERDMALSRACQSALQTAEQRVAILLEQEGEVTIAPFEPQGSAP